jgi:FkbM family methyltransferase
MHVPLPRQQLRRLLGALWPRVHHAANVAMWVAGVNTLKERGFHPRTVFDFGVAEGTPALYEAFPDAHFVLVDPTKQSLPCMERIAGRLDAQIFNIALGDRDGEMEIEARLDDINGATLFKEIGPLGPTHRYRVPMRRFDGLFRNFPRPALCKIDVQGAELMLLQGMGARIAEIDVFIVEMSVIATIEDAPEAHEVIDFMRHSGFVIFDVLGVNRRPLDNALAQLDLLFVKEGSPLRADRRWRASL